MKYFLSILIAVCIAGSVFAQGTLKGRITDAGGHTPLIGATITVAGKAMALTDKDGNFSMPCNGITEITVSFIGYETKRQRVKSCNETISIALAASNYSLDEVEITATSSRNKSLLYQPVSITKLNETELKRGTGLFLDDAINGNVPGVSMQRRAVSSGQQFNIRGYGNGTRGTNGISSNFDGQGYKVYLNGMPLTDAEGITLMDDIDFGSIGNVEVTKGPAGTLYGLAVAGVVNLKTVKPEKGKTAIGESITIGSYDLQRYTTTFQTASAHSSLLLNYGRQHTDGYMTHTQSRKDFVNLIADFEPSDKQTINAYFGYSSSYDERGGELTLAQYAAGDYSGNPEYIKRNGHSEIVSVRAGLGHTYAFSDKFSNTTNVFVSGLTNNSSSAAGWTDKSPINYGFRSSFDLKFDLKDGASLGGIAGIESQRQNAQIIGYNMVANPADPNAFYWVIGAMRSNQSTVTGTTSMFTEWTLSLPQDLSFTAGLGMSNMSIELNDKFFVAGSTLPTKFAKKYNGLVSPHFAVNKVFSKQFSLYAAYSRGYKAPVSSYFFIPATGKLNTDLKPEIGDQFELGTKGLLMNDKLSYQLAWFSAAFKDKMTAIAVPLNGSTVTTAYTYVANGGKQDDKGIELLLKYTAWRSNTSFFRTVSPFANLTYSDLRYVGLSIQALNAARTAAVITDYDGKQVAGVPRWVTNLGIDVNTRPGFYANLTWFYKDGMPISSDGANWTGSYSLLNGKLGFQRSVSAHVDLDLYLGVNNIGGVQYPNMVFVNQLPDAYLPAPRNAYFFGGINFKYNF
ncbi:MAG: TonB-dependent receptor [Chitinophagaceae bacterium]|nr:TonB-dependent receptor [Chitinophagaceae bacterium]